MHFPYKLQAQITLQHKFRLAKTNISVTCIDVENWRKSSGPSTGNLEKIGERPFKGLLKKQHFFCIFQKVKGSASNIYKLSFLNNPRIQKQTQWYLLLSNSSLHLSNTPCSSGCQMQRVVARTAGGVFF